MSREAKITLYIHFIFAIGMSMSSVFLNLYLWRLGHNATVNAYFQVINFGVVALSFIVGGWFVKRFDRILIYRIGIALVSVFYLAVIVAQAQVLTYYVGFAIAHGFVMAFYWIAYATLMYDVSTEQNRIRFLAINLTVFTIGSLSGPVIAGQIIQKWDSLFGYTLVFALACVMFLLATVTSLRIPSLRLPQKPLYVKQTWKLIRKNTLWQKSLVSFVIIG